jgi:hypothetical protein
MKVFGRIGTLFLGLGILAFVVLAWRFSQAILDLKRQKTETAEVILSQMQAVSKLVTAEGYFSEIYDYKDYYPWDYRPFRKKALMRVKAKVIMGYDLKNLDFRIDTESRTITITDPASPQILALEHDVDYYDLTAGTFNRFTEEDLNVLNDRAKNFISEAALQSDLTGLANSRKVEIFNTLRAIAETAGYTLTIQHETAGPAPIQ